MVISHRAAAAAGLICLSLLAAGCASSSSSTPAAGSSGASSVPASSAPASSAPASSAPASSAAAASTVQIKTAKTSFGTVLVNAAGFTLYWFAKDTTTSSACNGACAGAWPPVIGTPEAASGVTLSGKLGTIKRSDGSLQATYNGHPLYTYAGDTAAGQVHGNDVNGFGGLWYAVVTSGSAPASSPSAGGGGYGY
jgi:predicted lipoprotein with Yx(FWY)xxD motif